MTSMTSSSSDDRVRSTTFGGLSIVFGDRVLEPRQWTELHSEWAVELLTVRPGRLLELYAGVGHIGLVAAKATGATLVQVDDNPIACRYARFNAAVAGLAASVEIRCAPVERSLRAGERFALVVADPPYLPTIELPRHPCDPTTAVDGGGDGLDPARRCLRALDPVMVDGGRLLLQLRGRRQVDSLASELPEHIEPVEARHAGPDRAVLLLRYRGSDRAEVVG